MSLNDKVRNSTSDYLSWKSPGLGRNIFFMSLQFIIFLGIVLLYELGFLEKIFYKTTKPVEITQRNNNDIAKDEDVLEEERRISTDKSDFLCVDQLTKYYSSFMAVKGISFGVKEGDCFGLLG